MANDIFIKSKNKSYNLLIINHLIKLGGSNGNCLNGADIEGDCYYFIEPVTNDIEVTAQLNMIPHLFNEDFTDLNPTTTHGVYDDRLVIHETNLPLSELMALRKAMIKNMCDIPDPRLFEGVDILIRNKCRNLIKSITEKRCKFCDALESKCVCDGKGYFMDHRMDTDYRVKKKRI